MLVRADHSALRIPHSALVFFFTVAAFSLLAGDLGAQIDPRGTYRTWHTLHFRIHARAEHAAIALAAAREAERAYTALAQELRTPRGTIDITLYDNVDFPNGFTTVFPTSRVGIYLTPAAGEIGLAQYDDWLRLVITHELAHVFHLDRAGGFWGLLQKVFGRVPVLFPNAYRPSWVTEGLATYYESKLTGGGRVRGGFHRQLLTAGAVENRWPAPGDVNFGSPKWPDGPAPYAWGSRFFAWQAVTHGDSVIPRFIDATSARLWPLTIAGPLKQAGGEGLGAGWKDFRNYWQNLAVPKEQGAGGWQPADSGSLRLPAAGSRLPPMVVARGLRGEPHLRLSPDGKRLAYVADDGKHRARVVVRALADGTEAASHDVTSAPELAWVGQDLVLAQLDFTSPVEIRNQLFRWAPDGGWRRASRLVRLTRPFPAPAGGIGAIRMGPGTTSVVRVVEDSGSTPIPVPPAAAWSRLSLSPDGRWLAGSRHADGRWDIVAWPVHAPEEARRLTDDRALDDDPVWSPDGSSVVFTSERTGLPQIYAYRLAADKLDQLTAEPTGAREPALAEDGTLYYSTLLSDGYAVMSRRAVAAAPAAPEPSEQIAVLQPPEISPRETAYRSWGSLLPRYWFPFFHDAEPSGRFLGFFTSAADVLGRTSYVLLLTHAHSGPRWEGLLGVDYTRWSALSLDAYAQQFWDVGGPATVRGLSMFLAERDRAVSGGLTLRRRRWRSDFAARVGGEFTQDALFAPDSLGVRFTNPAFGGAVTSFGAAYLNRQALSVSWEDGFVVSGLYRRRWQIHGPGWSDEVRGGMRGYLGLSLPGFARWVVAARVTGAASGGPNARTFALGGESGGEVGLFPGAVVGSGTRDFPLRGYPPNALRFTRVVVGAAELRIPLVLIGKGIWKLPLGVDRISVTGFGEMGGGWRGSAPSQITPYRDVGGELVADLTVNGDASLRLRLGGARALTAGLGAAAGETRYYVAIGPSF